MQKILKNSAWTDSTNPNGTFHAFNPSNQQALLERKFPISNWEELEALVNFGYNAAKELAKVGKEKIAEFLETYANAINEEASKLATTASEETGLPTQPRLTSVEIPRAINQLKLAAAAARSGEWARPTLDTNANIRSLHGPLGGPVVVFGPNNFPFAFNGISGGDFAAAIAAGNPVIAKAHPGHPYTSQLLAEIANDAANKVGLPQGTVQLFYGTEPELGLKLVSHPKVAAVAFTGSRPGGLALKAAADKAGTPIYLEMSSVNPIFLLPGAVAERGLEIADELHASCTIAAGQFCTKPGLVGLVEDPNTGAFINRLSSNFSSSAAGTLLSKSGIESVENAVEGLKASGALEITRAQDFDTPQYSYPATLLKVPAADFLTNPEQLQNEAFGPVCLLVIARTIDELCQVAAHLEGNLTGSIYSDTEGSDDAVYEAIASILRFKVGRLLNDKVPTGVAVSPAMNHGGPYPATGHPGFTAVGMPASIIRFSALHCYDNVRANRLPKALSDKNSDGVMIRLVNGSWTTADA